MRECALDISRPASRKVCGGIYFNFTNRTTTKHIKKTPTVIVVNG